MAPYRRRPSSLARRLLVLILILGTLWGLGLFWFASSLPRTVTDGGTYTDAIVVLTGGSGRLGIGFDLLAEGRAQKLFISGVFPGTDMLHLKKMYQRNPVYLKDDDPVSFGTAINTAENARETATWMRDQGFTSLRLVTAGYHMPRSLLEFRHTLPQAVLIPHPVFPEHVKQDRWWAWPGTASLIIGEYNKFLLAWVRHTATRLTVGGTTG